MIKNYTHTLLIICFGAFLVGSLTACQQVAFTVNGESILMSDLKDARKFMGDSSDNDIAEKLINKTLILQDAKRLGISVSPEEVEKELETMRTEFGGVASLTKAINQYGLTMKHFRKDLEERLLMLSYTDALTNDVEVSDEQLKRYYETHQERFKRPARWRAILLSYPSLKEAEGARQALLQSPLEKVIPDEKQGLIEISEGTVHPKQQKYLSAVRKTSFNQPSEIVNTDSQKFDILIPTHFYPSNAPSFQDLEATLGTQVEQLIGQELLSQRLNSLRSQARIGWKAFKPDQEVNQPAPANPQRSGSPF